MKGADCCIYRGEMEREWVRNSSLCVPRSLERLERNESGSSVQDSLMLLQTIRRFTYLYPKIDQRPLQRFLRSSSRKMPLSFSFRECVMLSMEKKPVGRLSLVGSFNRYPIRKKGWSIAWKRDASTNRFNSSSFFSNYYSIQSAALLLRSY